MAATYDPTLQTAVDRVRFAIYDKAAPFRFQNEEIGAVLTSAGFAGDPTAQTSAQPKPELLASISLVESLPAPSSTVDSTTVKQGSVTRTNASGVYDRSSILASLYRRLNLLNETESGDFGPVVLPPYEDRHCPTVIIGL